VDIATVNGMDKAAFVAALGDVFEHSPWVAERAYERRPFASAAELHTAMADAVRRAPRERQLALLLAHPDLAGKEARDGTMTASSVSEQASAALDRLTPEEMARISELNRAYRARHGFPFIVAVRHYTKAGIFHEFERRIAADTESELAWALSQVYAITRMRIDARFAVPAAGS
jgi:2-oxo-4-hydroxy-4-carboxy-5-ureidoimidazoline decarboxylase